MVRISGIGVQEKYHCIESREVKLVNTLRYGKLIFWKNILNDKLNLIEMEIPTPNSPLAEYKGWY